MSDAFSVTIDDARLRTALQALAQRCAHPAPAMQDIARALANLTEDAFQAEGPGWEPLTAAYVQRPRRQGGRGGDAHPILQRSGQLAATIVHGGDDQAAWIGSGKIYAAIHQFGGKSGMAPGPAAVPARPYFPVDAVGTPTPAAQAEALAILAVFLAG